MGPIEFFGLEERLQMLSRKLAIPTSRLSSGTLPCSAR
jgi:hypothetical protein